MQERQILITESTDERNQSNVTVQCDEGMLETEVILLLQLSIQTIQKAITNRAKVEQTKIIRPNFIPPPRGGKG